MRLVVLGRRGEDGSNVVFHVLRVLLERQVLVSLRKGGVICTWMERRIDCGSSRCVLRYLEPAHLATR